ncbi:MAG: thiamine-phosphate kinase [Gammaproteobacteria bacterium]
MNEFDIIRTYFTAQICQRKDVALGIGDDAAIVTPPPNHQIIITTDTLVSGIHFLENANAYDIGFKSLAVNLSDLAAMGATPVWITLALTLPNATDVWLKDFSRGFFELATEYNVQLIGGDLSHGPLSITIQAQGLAPTDQAIRRSGAKAGDLIYVTHTVGDASLGLDFLQKKIAIPSTYQSELVQRLTQPTPRIKIGEALRGIASAAIDISDGLIADLKHILDLSQVGARVNIDHIPLSTALKESTTQNQALAYALSGGDDYELCFTIPRSKLNFLPEDCTCIGEITTSLELDLRFSDGTKYNLDTDGYTHF